MGSEPEWQIMPFEGIWLRIEEGAINMGSSSFTDNAERQKTVDFVNFLDAGSTWAAPVGLNVNPDDACGLTIAVQADTVQHTGRAARKVEGEDAGKPAIETCRSMASPPQPPPWCRVRLTRSRPTSCDR